MSLQVPAGECEREHVVKKSRFIARLVPVDSREAVNAAVAQARRDYPDARHHCWACAAQGIVLTETDAEANW